MTNPKEIAPELKGNLLFKMFPYLYSKTLSKLANSFLYRTLGGQVKSQKLRYEEKFISRPNGSQLRLCIYRSKEPATNTPGILWLHGGGYSMGIPEMDERTYEALMSARPCTIVAPDYRRSVDAPYPAALDDSYLALEWLKEHGAAYGCRSDQLMVGGNSAGGGLAVSVAMMARDKQEIQLAYQMPLYPMLDNRMVTESSRNNHAPVWNTRANQIAWELYLGKLVEIPIYASPAQATDYSGLPPAGTYVGDIEPFYDETRQYVKNLEAAGVPVNFKVYEGAYHGFSQVKPNTVIAQEAFAFFVENYRYACKHYFAKQVEK
ncbi:alpha/beta hydrolase [Enterococcus sp. 669A]|uniref:Alpha/beta hydrolase n=1 Tax=Candidatus Enterococcus moelleringii TaxID=2815325 RepID=A0ABS3LD78_9ENTE|nr:alpha/beta hydrolase [Enterococcus sp. 669A]MBO1307588.1 alpha/beta hydrolase [Enterococcus sp. 669A]